MQEEDLDKIKASLGEWYSNNIIESIEKLKKKAKNNTEDKYIDEDSKKECFESILVSPRIDKAFNEIQPSESNRSEILKQEKKIGKQKRTLQLHTDQIIVLKEQLRKNGEEISIYQYEIKQLENKLQSASAINLPYIKQIYRNLIAKIKVDKSTEDLVLILFKILDFTNEEIDQLQQKRKGYKKISKNKK